MHGSRIRWFLLLAALAFVAGPGCTRHFFRERADKDVAGVLTQKNVFPDWVIQSWHVYPDPRARFADPSKPDRPPYPPDDFAARMLSPNPQQPRKHAGAGRFEGDGYVQMLAQWDAENRAEDHTARPSGEPLPNTSVGLGKYPRRANYVEVANKPATRPSGVVVAIGEAPDKHNRMVPAVAIIPAKPQAPERADGVEPWEFNGSKPPPKEDGPMAVVLTGDRAADYLKALTTNESGYRIKLDQAVELGLLNSREFQFEREDLYLAALPVTLERFRFAGQAFLGETILRQNLGPDYPGGPRNFWQFGTDTGFAKLFPTGGTMLFHLANQFVVNLSGSRPDVAVSNLSLTLAQPFLRGGGYAVTLEPLTQSERNLLYAIRSYARFRKLFYVAITAAGGYTNNPYGLTGLSVNLGRGIGNNLTAPQVGYLQLLLQAAIISNQRKNVFELEELLRLYRENEKGGQQSQLQVNQVESQLLNSRTQLLGSSNVSTNGGANGGGGIRGFLDNLDNFKLQLGVPLTTPLEVDDTPLRDIRLQLERFELVYSQSRRVRDEARAIPMTLENPAFREAWMKLLTSSDLTAGTNFAKTITKRMDEWRALPDLDKELDRLEKQVLPQKLTELKKLLAEKAERQSKGMHDSPEEEKRISDLEREMDVLRSQVDVGSLARALRRYEAKPWLRDATIKQHTVFQEVLNAFLLVIVEGRNERLARVSQMWPALQGAMVDGNDLGQMPLDDAYTAAIQTALTHRLELMNARGQVVDAWRQIKVQANSLQGVFNVQYDLKGVTQAGGANPVSFSGERTSNSLTIDAELPLIRRAERNNYRAALIAYQRQRRILMSFEDNIANDVRADIRELRTLAEQYRMQQRLVELSYSVWDNAKELVDQPPGAGGQGQQDAASAAALTNQALQAQSTLLQSQNALYTIWVNYRISRMSLFLDLELMQVDDHGVWSNEQTPAIDDPRPGPDAERPGEQPAAPGERLPRPRPVAIPGRE